MIVRVEDPEGNVLHGCDVAGCEVSWDGYDRATGLPAVGRTDPVQVFWEIGAVGSGVAVRVTGERS